MSPTHERYPLDSQDRAMMALALRVAERGRPSPHPHIGAVVARDGELLSTGFLAAPGEAHAAVSALRKLGGNAQGATLYVTLEPCDARPGRHSCTEAILRAGVQRVVVGCPDRAPGHVGGTQRLREAGVEVLESELRSKAEALVAPFFHFATLGRPFVTLKAAVTLDGRMATRSGDSRWITTEQSRKHAHRMRDASDAIAVGVGTVIADDPELNVRHVRGRDPLRVVFDSQLRMPAEARMLRMDSPAKTLVLHCPEAPLHRRAELAEAGALLAEVPSRGGRLSLRSALSILALRGVVRLLVEGGPSVHGALLADGLADWAAIFVAPRIAGDPQAMPLAHGAALAQMSDAFWLESPTIRRFGHDVLFEGALKRGAGRTS
ncbi:MAG: hypothetical protein RL385_3652 [Pseudomonadota bacterium]